MHDYLQPKIITCAVCGDEFDASQRNYGKGIQKYCSKKCRQRADNQRHYKRRNPSKTEEELARLCVVCGLRFSTDAHHPNALACSVKCNEARMNAKRRRETAKAFDGRPKIECAECGAVFQPSKFARRDTKFCSPKCGYKAASRAYYSRNTRGWDPRLRTAKWKTAATAAKDRDHSCCRLCGKAPKRLNIHHLLNRIGIEDEDHSLSNLLTVCGACHRELHDIRLGKENGQYVITGKVFDWLNIDEVTVIHNADRPL